MRDRAVILWSGGIDSTLCLYQRLADANCSTVYGLFCDFGQQSVQAELHSIRRITGGIKNIDGFTDKFRGIHVSRLSLSEHVLTGGLPDKYAPGYSDELLPGRNTIFAMLGYYHARRVGATHVVLGIHRGMYPDCSPDWCNNVRAIFNNENISCYGDDDHPHVALSTPIVTLDKPDVINMARKIGVLLDDTWSCHFPVFVDKLRVFEPCGACGPCKKREALL